MLEILLESRKRVRRPPERRDFIVVGAGSAGCAVAHELVKAGRSVLLLEAGGSDRSANIRFPLGCWRINPRYKWGYRSQPDPTRNGAVEEWSRGRVLGGTSSINGMIYVRGPADDFDRWDRKCGHVGAWSSGGVMPIFRDFENSDQVSPGRGRTGPLYVRTVKRPHPITDAFIQSACAANVPFNPDYNAATQEGVGYLQFTQRNGLRWNAADAFLRPILGRSGFELRANTVVERVELSKGRASSVVFRMGDKVYRETAEDIVLSAGAINTPKLLMLSGIGDPAELSRHGIDTLLNLPAVGAHLQEHPYVAISYRSKAPTYNLTEGLLQKLSIAAKYLFHHEGPLAGAYEAVAFLKTSITASVPEVQLFFAPIGWGKVGGSHRLLSIPALKIVILRSHPVSSGRIRLASSDPAAAPAIECRLLAPEDVAALARAIEVVRVIMATEPIASLMHSEIEPGPAIAEPRALYEYIRDHAGPACHPVGTCRMGTGDDSVVGPDLRVHGTDNLWIADASITPDPISANLNAVCMMIGTKLGKVLAGGSCERRAASANEPAKELS